MMLTKIKQKALNTLNEMPTTESLTLKNKDSFTNFILSETYPGWYVEKMMSLLSFWDGAFRNNRIDNNKIPYALEFFCKLYNFVQDNNDMSKKTIDAVFYSLFDTKLTGPELIQMLDDILDKNDFINKLFYCDIFYKKDAFMLCDMQRKLKEQSEVKAALFKDIFRFAFDSRNKKDMSVDDIIPYALLAEKINVSKISEKYKDIYFMDDYYCKIRNAILEAIKSHIAPEKVLAYSFDIKKMKDEMILENYAWLLKTFPSGDCYQSEFDKTFFDEKDILFLEQMKNALATRADKTSIELSIPAVKVKIKRSNSAINISFSQYKKVYCNNERALSETNYKTSYRNIGTCLNIVLFHDGQVYEKRKRDDRLIPLSYKRLFLIHQRFSKIGKDFVANFIEYLFSSGTFVAKDIYAYSDKILIAPITINDSLVCPNLNNLMHKKYKKSDFINWNAHDINFGYMLLKSVSSIEKQQRNKFLNYRDENIIPELEKAFYDTCDFSMRTLQEKIKQFVSQYLIMNLVVTDIPISDAFNTAYDYIRLQKLLHKKVHIGFKSYKKLVEAHNKASLEYEKKTMVMVKIPSKSRFKELQNILPKDFEWIKTKTRLREESDIMHNCVYSYADDISSDKCAIYSLEFEDKRYTIEFVKTNANYVVKQMYSFGNSRPTKEARQYVNNFLQKKQVETTYKLKE